MIQQQTWSEQNKCNKQLEWQFSLESIEHYIYIYIYNLLWEDWIA